MCLSCPCLEMISGGNIRIILDPTGNCSFPLLSCEELCSGIGDSLVLEGGVGPTIHLQKLSRIDSQLVMVTCSDHLRGSRIGSVEREIMQDTVHSIEAANKGRKGRILFSFDKPGFDS